MIFAETDNHLLIRIDEIIEETEDAATKKKLEDLKRVIIERIETRQKEAMMYLTSTLDLGNYINKEILELLINMKDQK